MKVLEDFQMGYENLKRKLDGLWVFGEKIIFPSAPVLGINNDQSLTSFAEKSISVKIQKFPILHCMKLRVFYWLKPENIPYFREKSDKFRRKYGVFIDFRHMKTLFFVQWCPDKMNARRTTVKRYRGEMSVFHAVATCYLQNWLKTYLDELYFLFEQKSQYWPNSEILIFAL